MGPSTLHPVRIPSAACSAASSRRSGQAFRGGKPGACVRAIGTRPRYCRLSRAEVVAGPAKPTPPEEVQLPATTFVVQDDGSAVCADSGVCVFMYDQEEWEATSSADGKGGGGRSGGSGGDGGDGDGDDDGGVDTERFLVDIPVAAAMITYTRLMVAAAGSVALGLFLFDHDRIWGGLCNLSVSLPPPANDADLYARFAFAGAMCCGLSHGALTPVDVVKTRMQLNPRVYSRGLMDAFGQVVRKEGPMALLTGFTPTFFGYFLQGCFKFGGYEFFKRRWVESLGPEEARERRTLIYLSSAAAAEVMADVALCPLESARIRLVANPSFAAGLGSAVARIARENGILKGFYGGFVPMLFKQVPYTMAKFVVFEALSDAVFAALPAPKAELSTSAVTCVNLGSGVGAGVAAAIISHPADTLLSMINKPGAGGSGPTLARLANIVGELGPAGLLRGIQTRCVMIGLLTAAQFGIYGEIKRVLHATGGTDISK